MGNLARFWQKFSLAHKISSLVSLLVILTVGSLTTMSVLREQKTFRNELANKADLLLQTISLTLRDSLYVVRLDELRAMASVMKSDEESITYFVVYDAMGKLLVDASSPQALFSQTPDSFGVTLIDLPSGQIYHQWQIKQYLVGQPVYLGNEVIGAVAIGLSTAPLDEKIANLTLQSSLLAAVVLVFGIGLTLIMSRKIVRPLEDLTQAAAEMTKGNLSKRVVLTSHDEIGHLGHVFNQMTEAIQNRERELQELATTLESTVAERTLELRKQADALHRLAISDPLTMIYNRRHFFSLAEKEFARAYRYGDPLSLIMFDADFFKDINDTYGHPYGDDVLIELAQICLNNIRSMDIFARYGGEEFVLLMPNTDGVAAMNTAERLRTLIENNLWGEESRELQLTLSLGVSSWDGQVPCTLAMVIERADRALYQSKEAGRNCVTYWNGDGETQI